MKQLFLVCMFLFTSQAICEPVVIKDSEGRERYHTGLKHREKKVGKIELGVTHVQIRDCGALPDTFDLSDVGVSLPVRDQGQCGSCWAFSKTATLESSLLASGGNLVDLSPQELVSCDRNNEGCNGGNLNDAEYQIVHGQGKASDFPYSARDVPCKSIPMQAKGQSFVKVGPNGQAPSAQQVQCALYMSHTIPWITVSASDSWGSFSSVPGTIENRSCQRGQTNHAIGVVGWKTVNGQVYFKIRNSWGAGWGQAGYSFMGLGCDSLGDEVAYITTAAMPCKPPMVKLPISVSIKAGDAIELAVKAVLGVKYTWSVNGNNVGTGPTLDIHPTVNTVYKVTATNNCGTAESSTQVIMAK